MRYLFKFHKINADLTEINKAILMLHTLKQLKGKEYWTYKNDMRRTLRKYIESCGSRTYLVSKNIPDVKIRIRQFRSLQENKNVAIRDVEWHIENIRDKRSFTRRKEVSVHYHGNYKLHRSGSITTLREKIQGSINVHSIERKPLFTASKYVGIELEFISLLNRDKVEALLSSKWYAGHVSVVSDGSICSDDVGLEVRILGVRKAIPSIVKDLVADLKEIGCYVNNSCGVHVHLDARQSDKSVMFHNLVKSIGMLSSMVPVDRTVNSYCTLNKIADYDEARRAVESSRGPRYRAINTESYHEHGTIEVRLHSGTLNATKVINWCNILYSIVDLKFRMASSIDNLTDFVGMFPDTDSKLIEYIHKRVARFVDRTIDTSKDEQLALDIGA